MITASGIQNLNSIVREDLTEKVTFEQSLERD